MLSLCRHPSEYRPARVKLEATGKKRSFQLQLIFRH
jgi:hypothetical protein